ncbi:HNH endonuclease [Nocardia pseudobrasiliensis]|uniref:HNH endonuclease n=1 Tax=Nocardia pseudobrasiliensis TaxID=45979 RepID=UPI0035A255C9
MLARDGFQCRLRFSGCAGDAVEVDHIVNHARGGSDEIDNLQAVCAPCHRKKTGSESAQARAEVKHAARHPNSLLKHPGYK